MPRHCDAERYRYWVLGLFAAGLVAGCSGEGAYREVSGTVLYRGTRIEDGTIQFYSSNSAHAAVKGDSPAPVAGATIKSGEYVVPAAHGIKAGKYVVRISSRERIKDKTELNPFLSREIIPDKYNDRSILTIDLESQGRSRFDFTLE